MGDDHQFNFPLDDNANDVPMTHYYHQNSHSQQKYVTNDAGDTRIAMHGNHVIHERPRWSWCSTFWSFITMCLCGSICGMLGLLCSVFSYVDHKSGDYDRSSKKKKWAWGCTILGIFLAICGLVAFLVLYFVFGYKEFDSFQA